MFKKFLPKKHFKNVYRITPEYLQDNGIKGLITDLDNTLIRWDHPDATPEILAWFKGFQDAGIQVVICSNNKEHRVKRFADQVDLPYEFMARKPLPLGFNRAVKRMNLSPKETAVVGDQLMTDVFGGNLGGFFTLLVTPIVKTDEWKTYLNRKMEKIIMRHFSKHNMLEMEEEQHGERSQSNE